MELLERCGFDTFTDYLEHVDEMSPAEQFEEAVMVVGEMMDILGEGRE